MLYMGFNGKSLILIGIIIFIFQIANFISIETITPELERAQVLAAIASLIIILIGFLFKQFQPIAGENAVLKGENKFLFDRNMPNEVIDELAWGSEAILTSTAAATILIHNDGVNILRRGITSEESTLSDNNKLLKLKGNVKLKTLKNNEDILNADNFIWNIENTNYLLEGNIRFENQNIILNSGKAILGADNIIEFFNPVKYIIKDENNENKYEINSENAFYNLNTESVSFEAKDKRVKSIIYF